MKIPFPWDDKNSIANPQLLSVTWTIRFTLSRAVLLSNAAIGCLMRCRLYRDMQTDDRRIAASSFESTETSTPLTLRQLNNGGMNKRIPASSWWMCILALR